VWGCPIGGRETGTGLGQVPWSELEEWDAGVRLASDSRRLDWTGLGFRRPFFPETGNGRRDLGLDLAFGFECGFWASLEQERNIRMKGIDFRTCQPSRRLS